MGHNVAVSDAIGVDGIEPDTKDWTWVIGAVCPDCGFDGPGTPPVNVGDLIRAGISDWMVVLDRDDVALRPASAVWSALECACHVRDVHRIFAQRLTLMLEQDNPPLPSWDQDVAAVEGDYAHRSPPVVAGEFLANADEVAATYDAVPDDAWQRTGQRGNGAAFTVETLALYHLHDVVHHAWDVHK